jgi:hypothetical protein
MDHPFTIGEKYRNRRGEYEVIGIDGDKITIRYSDGSVDLSSIEMQWRIIRNMEIDERIQLKSKQKKKPSLRRVKTKADFEGLKDSDFQKGVGGTSWRGRAALGGLMAQALYDSTGYNFQSWSIYRKAEIHFALPDCYTEEHKQKSAKFRFKLNEEGARCGLYIEKSDKEMGDDWDWPRFMECLEKKQEVRASLEEAMAKHHFRWEMFCGENVELEAVMEMSENGLVWNDRKLNQTSPVSWDQFVEHLNRFPDDEWLNLHLRTDIPKETAITRKLDLATLVADMLSPIAPLYIASVQTAL